MTERHPGGRTCNDKKNPVSFLLVSLVRLAAVLVNIGNKNKYPV